MNQRPSAVPFSLLLTASGLLLAGLAGCFEGTAIY